MIGFTLTAKVPSSQLSLADAERHVEASLTHSTPTAPSKPATRPFGFTGRSAPTEIVTATNSPAKSDSPTTRMRTV